MEPKDFVVTKIEGEYAYLKELDSEGEEIFIALFLLPQGVDVGTKIHYEMMEYRIV